MKIYTIGFTQKTAEQFFDLLARNKIERIVDIRLHPDGQLAGFTKKEDLRFFLDRLNGCMYQYMPQLAPKEEMLKGYRADHDWLKYEKTFEALMDERGIPQTLNRAQFEEKTCCLLCSEPTPEKCHRRLVAGRLARKWEGVEIIHL
jgi:uncharacterized protein (DUF488 family)